MSGEHRRHGPAPFADAPCGTCKWCGQAIVHGRTGQRSWHDGREDEPDCLLVYFIENDQLKAAWKHLIARDGPECQTCGTVLFKPWGEGRWTPADWLRNGPEVDHVVPVIDGGTRRLENLQLLCPGCHRTKTAAEARARAAARRHDAAQPDLFTTTEDVA